MDRIHSFDIPLGVNVYHTIINVYHTIINVYHTMINVYHIIINVLMHNFEVKLKSPSGS